MFSHAFFSCVFDPKKVDSGGGILFSTPSRKVISWHILGDRLIPLAPLSLVGFYR